MRKIKKSADCVETWHTCSRTNSKNFFLLTFFRKIASSTYICNISGFLIQGDLSLTYSKSIFSMKQRRYRQCAYIAKSSTANGLPNGPKKFSPRAQSKWPKVAKGFFQLYHHYKIDDLTRRNGPHGLGP